MAGDFEYDNLGRVTDIDYGAGVVHFGYAYEANENNIDTKTFYHRTGTPSPANDYDYDDLDRLTDVTYHNAQTEVFNMDNLGNRTSVTKRDTAVDTYALDSATNRYDASTGGPYDVTCAYDAAGNTTQDKDNYAYFYDYENRVVKIEDSSSNDVAEYAYDALGRRIRMIDKAADPDVATLYYYNPDWQVLAEYDGANGLQRYFVYGNYIDEPLVMNDGMDDFFYVQDHLYSTVALLDDSGNVVERYEYDAYGTVHVMDASYNSRSVSSYGSPYTFTGRRLDLLDGVALLRMHYRHRDYDMYAGRFVQHDCLGLVLDVDLLGYLKPPAQYAESANLYQYTRSLPNVLRDPMGLGTWVDRPHPWGEFDKHCEGDGPCQNTRLVTCIFSRNGDFLTDITYTWAPENRGWWQPRCKQTLTRNIYDRESYTGEVYKKVNKEKNWWRKRKEEKEQKKHDWLRYHPKCYCIYYIKGRVATSIGGKPPTPGASYRVHVIEERHETHWLYLDQYGCEHANGSEH